MVNSIDMQQITEREMKIKAILNKCIYAKEMGLEKPISAEQAISEIDEVMLELYRA